MLAVARRTLASRLGAGRRLLLPAGGVFFQEPVDDGRRIRIGRVVRITGPGRCWVGPASRALGLDRGLGRTGAAAVAANFRRSLGWDVGEGGGQEPSGAGGR